MNLQELLAVAEQRPVSGVPDWMLGYFRRVAISFFDGTTDTETQVCWLQSRNFTIDLRLPVPDQCVPALPWETYTREALQVRANYEGWEALCDWRGGLLSWHSETSYQAHNRWQEPAILHRMGNCMIEFSPSGAYVEDWRLQTSTQGPLIGLRLIHERDCETGVIRHQGGGLIVCGDYAGLVLGRPQPLPVTGPNALRELVDECRDQPEVLARLFGHETSVAAGNVIDGYQVQLSTDPQRIGQALFSLDGFEWLEDSHCVKQVTTIDGKPCERLFAIDTIEPLCSFALSTDTSAESRAWFQQEAQTLQRYTRVLQ